MIVDGHAHVGASAHGNLGVLLQQLDESGIDRVLVVPGGMVDVREMSRVLMGKVRPDPNIPNHLVYDALERQPDRVYGFVCLNPREGAAAVRMMEDGFRHGCRGVKLAPIVHQCPFDEPALAEVAAACGERGFPVYTHVLPKPGCTTDDFAALARRWPGTNFILGHMGFGPGDADAIDFAAELANLCLETSQGNYLIMRMALERLGPGKLIFGSEFPLGHPRAELVKVRLLDPAAHGPILAGNILGLLGVTT
jgi:predicted TIM-barrel fold metal-dependent hydrolase